MNTTVDLSVEDICKIVSLSSQAGVSEFQFGGLVLKFHPLGQAGVMWPSQAVGQVADGEKSASTDLRTSLANEQALSDAEEAQTLIEDPFAYERSVMLRDLERKRAQDGEEV